MEHTRVPAGSIVVGVDGSSHADQALDWAVAQAVLEKRPLAILHAMDLLGPGQARWLDTSAVDTQLTQAQDVFGRGVLDRAAERVAELAPELDVHQVLWPADPRNALLAESADAATIVIGSRGRGPVASLLLGSVGVAVSKHAVCPVVVIRPRKTDATGDGVLVGVDGSALDRPVVEFAFRIASLRALPLTVLHCFWDAAHLGRAERVVADDEGGLDNQRQLLRNAVSQATGEFPEVTCRLELARGFADQRLIERATTMDVVVVGSRRPGQFQDLGVSSLSPTVVEHAQCAVAVVPLVR